MSLCARHRLLASACLRAAQGSSSLHSQPIMGSPHRSPLKFVSSRLRNSLIRKYATQPETAAASAAAEEAVPAPTPAGAEQEFAPNIVALVDEIGKLNLMEIADLNKLIKKRFNLPDSPAMMMGGPMMAAAPAQQSEGDAEAAAPAKKTSFSVKLTKFEDGKKIQLIKEVKALVPGLNLVQAKNFVENLPQTIKSDIGRDEADELTKKLSTVGGTVEVE